MLQSHGDYLTGGYRERHYPLLKQWANVYQEALYKRLGSRYICTGNGCMQNIPYSMTDFPIIPNQLARPLDEMFYSK